MATWAVTWVHHVTTPFRRLVRLVVKNVPRDIELTWDDIEAAGYSFGEFGIPRANHRLFRVTRDAPADVKRQIAEDAILSITYEQLLRKRDELNRAACGEDE
jgi:hypothetical protein